PLPRPSHKWMSLRNLRVFCQRVLCFADFNIRDPYKPTPQSGVRNFSLIYGTTYKVQGRVRSVFTLCSLFFVLCSLLYDRTKYKVQGRVLFASPLFPPLTNNH